MNWPLFRYILTAAGRDRFFLTIGGILVIVICLAIFFGASVITEQDQFARSFASFGVRLAGVVMLVLFVVSHVRRSFESRDVDYLLSRPIGRIRFILTHALAFSALALIAALLLGGTIAGVEARTMHAGVWLWWAGVAAEFVIMANVAMFFSFVITSHAACMSIIFAFYLLARLIGQILGILHRPSPGPVIDFLGKAMEMISIFIPRLDLLGQSKLLLYGGSSEISFAFVLGQGAVFVCLMIAATLLDMHRRQF